MSWKLYFDGGCMPRNPGGIATFGWVLYTPDSIKHLEDYGIVKEGEGATNNVAEMTALLFGLSDAYLAGARMLKCYGDSQLTINMASGKWKGKKPHLKLIRDKINLVKPKFQKVTFTWIRRELNSEADRLTELAYEEHTGLKAQFIITRKTGR